MLFRHIHVHTYTHTYARAYWTFMNSIKSVKLFSKIVGKTNKVYYYIIRIRIFGSDRKIDIVDEYYM